LLAIQVYMYLNRKKENWGWKEEQIF
jgi:hypothetical protein